jgi:hypothetical protein
MEGRAAWLALLLALLAGCATPPYAPPATPPSKPAPAAPPTGRPALSKETLAYLAKRKLTPITGNALNVRADCSFQDDNGYRGQLLLAVRNSVVEQLDARVDVPNRGSCQFRLADFRQAETLPIVVLAARQSDCKASLWEQGDQITVAFRDCRLECSGDAADYLWPILVDSRKGSCS